MTFMPHPMCRAPRLPAAIIVPILVTLFAPQSGSAQYRTAPPSAVLCATAAQVLSAGTPPPTDEAWSTATRCGPSGGRALSTRLSALRGTTDSARLLQTEAAARTMRDANIFQAARSLATDASASDRARALGLRVLLAQHDPGRLIASLPTSLSAGARCRTMSAAVPAPEIGTALSGDYAAQIDAAARSVLAGVDSATPTTAQATAFCVRRLMRGLVPPQVTPSALQLTYVCGRKFRVRNPNPDWADVTFAVANTPEHGDLKVAPNGEAYFTTWVAGPTSLYYNPGHKQQTRGTLLQTRANDNTVCP